MLNLEIILLAFAGIGALLALLVALRPQLTRAPGGKMVAFVALFLLPALTSWTGFSEHMDRSKRTEFCLSCHVMNDFGRSLYLDDPSYIPAGHFQNSRIPRDRACYTCHTTYTLYGPMQSKLRGLRHLYVQYLGDIPQPDEIRLYSPYSNRECLYCHEGARSFEEASPHRREPDLLGQVKANALSCMSANCHDFVHEIGGLHEETFWEPAE